MAIENRHGVGVGGMRAQSPLDSPSGAVLASSYSAEAAANIAFASRLTREVWAGSYSLSNILAGRKARGIVAAFDGLPTSEDQTPTRRDRKAQVIARRLEGQQAQLRAEAEGWDPVQTRHAILEAASVAANLGKPYRRIFQERAGLTNDDLERIHDEVRPATETMKVLTQEQRFAAEAVCARLLLERCLASVQSTSEQYLLPHQRVEETSKLLQAHIRVQSKQTGETLDEQEADDRARAMVPELEAGRDKIFDKAQLWDKKDCTRKLKATGKLFRKLVNSDVLSDLTDIPEAEIETARKSGRLQVAGSWTLAVLNEAVSHAPGIGAAVEFDQVQDYIPTHNPWIQGAATVGLYGLLSGSLVWTSFSSANLLKTTGVGLDPWSKSSYDYAIDDEKKNAVKGALKYHASWEGPFAAVGMYIGAKYGWEAGLAYFNTASAAAFLKNLLIVNPAAGAYSRAKNAWDRRKEREASNSFLPE